MQMQKHHTGSAGKKQDSEMKKMLIIALVVIAVPLYTYNALLLFEVRLPGQTGSNGEMMKSTHTFEQLLIAAMPAKFEIRGRDPFTLYIEKPAPPPVKTGPAVKKNEKKEVAPPPLAISGIMWHPDNPVAMVKMPDGPGKLVKPGQEIGTNLRVKKIDKKSVTVVFEDREFVIEKH
jgi:hypothetical protein